VPPHMHRTQQAVDAFATHRHTTGIRLTVRADAASSYQHILPQTISHLLS